jgi:hypothetical protein
MSKSFIRLIVLAMICGMVVTACAGRRGTSKPVASEKFVTVAIRVDKAPNPVRAFGLDVLYPASVMVYQKADPGALLQDGASFFGVNEVSPGRIRIGGLAPGTQAIAEAAGGELVRLTFKAAENHCSEFQITALKDDIKDWLDGAEKHLVIECPNQ